MGVNNKHVLGRNRQFYAKAETTFGTATTPANTDAITSINVNFTFNQARENRMDSRSTRSLLERYSGKKTCSWSSEHYIVPSGSAGTIPETSVLLTAVMGTQADNANDVVYTLSDSQALTTGLTLVQYYNEIFMERATGAWVESLQISGKGGDAPRFKFEGGCADIVTTGTSTLNGATSGSTVTVQTADKDNFDVGSNIQFASGGTGYLVTAKSGAVLTVNGTPAASNGATVTPFAETPVYVGSVLGGISGSFTLDGTTIGVLTEFEVNIKNNIKPVGDEALQEKVTDIIVGHREVSGSVTIRGRSDMIKYHAMRRTDITDYKPIVITLGTTAGSILTISIPRCEFNPEGIEIPESEEAIIKLPFVALASSSGADEISLTFT